MIIRELLNKIGFDVDTKGIETLNRSINSAKSTIFTLGATITAAAASVFALVKNVSTVGDEINKSSEELGLSTDALQEWRYAADQAGISNEELATSVRMFSRNIGEAVTTGTGPFVDRMNQLGVSVVDANGKLKDNDTLLLQVADALKNVKNASERGAIAQEFFGRSGLRMATFLSKGSEEVKLLRERAHDLGLVLDKESVNAAEEFNDRLSDVFQVVKAIKNQVGSGLMPVMKEAALTFLDWSIINREIIKQNLTKFLNGIVEALQMLWQWGVKLARGFDSLSKYVGGTENALLGLAAAFLLVKLSPLISGLFTLTGVLWSFFAGLVAVEAGVLLIPIAMALFITAIILAVQELLIFFGVMEGGTGKQLSAWDAFKIAILAVLGAILLLRAVAFAKWLYDVAAALVSATVASWGIVAPWLVFLGLLGVIIFGLWKFNETWNELLGPFTFIDKLKFAWLAFKTWITSLFKDMTDWIGKKFDAFVDSIVEKVTWLTDKLKSINPFADEPRPGNNQSPRVALATGSNGSLPQDPLGYSGEGYKSTPRPIENFMYHAAREYQAMDVAPAIAPGQIYNAGSNINNTNNSNTVTNNRPVNVTSNVNVTLPPGTSGIQQQDVTTAVKAAWQEELQKVLETGLFNNTELE